LPWGGEITERPIRVLVDISNPDDLETKYNLPQADVALERAALEEAFFGVPGVQVDFLDKPVTLERMEEKLRQGYHVLHFLGHGAFSVKRQQAALYLQDTFGHAARVLDDDIANMLTRQGVRPRLMFLAACQSAMRSSADAFRGLGPKLVQAGVPAVVAMQDFVSVETARKFSSTFYRRLMEHGQVDLATNEARSTLLTAGRPDAAVPVLFMRIESGLLWSECVPQVVHEYLSAMRDYCASLPYLSLHDIRPPKTLDEVYIPLKARPQPRKDEKQERDEDADRDKECARREVLRSESLSIAEVMSQRDQPHVLILGEPGAGKSTLLRQMAERAWNAPDKIGLDAPCLPILIPLRRLATAEGALEERFNRALTAELTLTQALPQGFFTDWPKQTGANWLLLLDALDEVPAEPRAQLMQWLKGLLSRIGQNRVVLTSRPSGYMQDELDEKLFGHYDLLPFTPEQTGEFALRWFDRDQAKADRFLQELDRVRARDLRGTPLLLTIAAKVYLEEGTLPERRSGLYEQFVDIWLGEAKQRGLRAELGEPVCDVTKFALARLALAMTEQPAQTEASLSKVAADYLRDAVPFTSERAEIAGEKFLKVMARRSGVFTRRGDVYDFIHPTFREYLVAWTVVRESKRDSAYDLEHVWQQAVSRWADDNWREVALFALSLLSDAGQGVTALIRMWQQNVVGLHFAGAVLAEQVKVDKRLCDGIIDGLFTSIPSEKFWTPSSAINLLGRLRPYPRAGDRLLALVSDYRVNWWMSERVPEALGQLGRAGDLQALAHDEKMDERVRERAAEALGQLGQTEEAAPILLAMVRDDTVEGMVRERVPKALGQLGRADDLLAIARDDTVDKRVRERAAEALGQLGQTDEAAPILLAMARDDKVEVRVRVNAAEAMSQLGRAGEAAPILVALAYNDKVDVYERQRAAEMLGQLERAGEAAQAWRALVYDDRVGVHERVRAAEALAQLGQTDEATSILLTFTYDEKVDAYRRVGVAEALGRLGRVNEATSILLALGCDEKVDAYRRVGVAEALGQLGRVEEATRILLALAHDDKVNVYARQSAAKALDQLGQADQAKPILLALARDEEVDGWARVDVAETLGRLGLVDEATSILLALGRDEKVIVYQRIRAAEALEGLGQVNGSVRVWLVLACDDRMGVNERERAIKALGQLGRADEAAPILLSVMRDEKVETSIRLRAAESLGKLGRANDLMAVVCNGKMDEWVRERAAEALGKLGLTDEAAPTLLALACDDNVENRMRMRAAEALGQLGLASEAAQAWLALVRDGKMDGWIRERAAEALGWFADASILLVLEQIAQEDKSEYVRRNVRQSIERIHQRA
jgi:HEAT repeat protein